MSGVRKPPLEAGTAASPLAALEARATDLAQRITAAKAQLRQALLAGASTRAIRTSLEALESEATAVTMELSAARVQQAQQEASELEQAATITAADSARRLMARLAAIKLPPRPQRGKA